MLEMLGEFAAFSSLIECKSVLVRNAMASNLRQCKRAIAYVARCWTCV